MAETTTAPAADKTHETLVKRLIIEIDQSKKIHSVSFWTGLVGSVILLLDQQFGFKLNVAEFVSLAGVLASFIIAGHFTAASIFTSIAKLVGDFSAAKETKKAS